jgi:hypothetical protein
MHAATTVAKKNEFHLAFATSTTSTSPPPLLPCGRQDCASRSERSCQEENVWLSSRYRWGVVMRRRCTWRGLDRPRCSIGEIRYILRGRGRPTMPTGPNPIFRRTPVPDDAPPCERQHPDNDDRPSALLFRQWSVRTCLLVDLVQRAWRYMSNCSRL